MGGSPNEKAIRLTALSLAILMLGSGDTFAAWTVDYFAQAASKLDDARWLAGMRAFWETIERSAPFLAGHLSVLTGWLDDADQPDHTGRPASDVAVARSCFEALASMDVPGCVERAGGELIGPVYMFLQSKSDREAKGSVFTASEISHLMAWIIFGAAPIHDGGSIIEPACGAGSTVVQAVIHLRDQGLDPAAYRWVLNDYDPMAVALAGVNAVAYGFGPNVELSCQNILTDPELPGERSDSETAGGHPE